MRATCGAQEIPLERLYRTMVEIRSFEEALGELWWRGRISGELHLGTGEEGAVAGVVDHLRAGDGMALDHRSTPPLVARGSDLEALVLEMLGDEAGLCRGHGGHMHLFDPDRLAASSGIVGSSGPTACGFALSHQQLADGRVAVAFFGEGAANQGMLLESWNLAATWRLPVVFVCKDNGWAITTRSARLTGGRLVRRARGFGLPAAAVDGADVAAVWRAAARAIDRARHGGGPSFLLVRVRRPHGHFEDDPLVRMAGDPRELWEESQQLLRQVAAPGPAAPVDRARGLAGIVRTLAVALAQRLTPVRDPLAVAARRLGTERSADVRRGAAGRVGAALEAALAVAGSPQ